MHVYDVVVVGAGPAGLATAIAASRANLTYVVLEKGALVNSVLNFPTHMVFFTTPELLEIGDVPLITPYEKPTRLEALRYYRRVADVFQLDVQLEEDVRRVYEDADPDGARVLAVETRSIRGVRRVLQGRSVVIATGAYDLPNLVGVPGEELPHVSHFYREAHPYYRKRVVIVGGKNSAAEAALELYRSGAASVTIVHRDGALGDSIKYWVKPDIENRIREGTIAARFETTVVEIRPTTIVIERDQRREELPADAVLLMTGYHSDTTLFERAGVRFDPQSLEPVYDPETFETNVPGIYLAGAVITGRNSGRIFIENGRFHGQQVVSVIGRRLASDKVGVES